MKTKTPKSTPATKTITFRPSPAVNEMLSVAGSKARSRSKVINRALQAWLESHGFSSKKA